MNHIDLFELREKFNLGRILLCFNGPISRSLIEEIGNALKNHLQAEAAQPSAAMDVFSIYVEMTQNIRHYTTLHNYEDPDNTAIIIVARDQQQRYVIQSGNVVEMADGEALQGRIEALSKLDKAELKAAYKTQLRMPKKENVASGAGLGLIDMARKSVEPLSAELMPLAGQKAFFSVRAVV